MTTITITIPDEVYERLRASVGPAERDVTAFIRGAIDQALARSGVAGLAVTAEPSISEAERERRRNDEVERLRGALGDVVWSTKSTQAFIQHMLDQVPPMTDEEIEAELASLPMLDPPISRTIIDMRDEESSSV